MERKDDYFTVYNEELFTLPARELLNRMGEQTGYYDAKHYLLVSIEYDYVVILFSKNAKGGGGRARLDKRIAGALEEAGDPYGDPEDYPLFFHDNWEQTVDLMRLLENDEDAWTSDPRHAGKPPVTFDDDDFAEWVRDAPVIYYRVPAYEYLMEKLIIRPPEGDETGGQIVGYLTHD